MVQLKGKRERVSNTPPSAEANPASNDDGGGDDEDVDSQSDYEGEAEHPTAKRVKRFKFQTFSKRLAKVGQSYYEWPCPSLSFSFSFVEGAVLIRVVIENNPSSA
jgi:hypothetical protein